MLRYTKIADVRPPENITYEVPAVSDCPAIINSLFSMTIEPCARRGCSNGSSFVH